MTANALLGKLSAHWEPLPKVVERAARLVGITKVTRSLAMAASAATACAVRSPSVPWTAMAVVFCVFVVCLGAATLNNFQDRHIDAKLQRTRARPLVTGEIEPRSALIQAMILLGAGMLGLFIVSGSAELAMTALIGVCIYNLLYTPLKRRTSLAIIPGAACGVFPILMGWMAGGGGLASSRVWILMAALGVWQLPHFWLVLLASREDYRESGIPNILRFLSVHQLHRMIFVWVASFAVLTLLLPLYRIVSSEAAAWVLLANALILTAVFGGLLFFERRDDRYRHLFRQLSLSTAVVMSVIVVDGVA